MFFKAQNPDGIESTYRVDGIMSAKETKDGFWLVTMHEADLEFDVRVPDLQMLRLRVRIERRKPKINPLIKWLRE